VITGGSEAPLGPLTFGAFCKIGALSASNQIVRDHKGYIDVESELGKGSSFFINLPINQDHPKRRKSDLENNQSISNTFEER
jgi:hypothetical protein